MYDYSNLITFTLQVVVEVEDSIEPSTYEAAMKDPDVGLWMTVMEEELQSLYKNETWNLVKHLKDRNVVRCKWVFKRKVRTQDNHEVQHKARLVLSPYKVLHFTFLQT
jgi:hypothetical protein